MVDVNEMKKLKQAIVNRSSQLHDTLYHYALWYGYDKIKIISGFNWLEIYVYKGQTGARVIVTYEALIYTDYITLMDEIKEAIKASFECACTIPIEFENPYV